MIQGSVHSSFNATFDWQSFDVALRKTQEIWSKNQFSTEWSSSIVDEKLDIKFTKNVTAKSPSKEPHIKTIQNSHRNELKSMFFLRKEETTQNFAKKP